MIYVIWDMLNEIVIDVKDQAKNVKGQAKRNKSS